MSFAERFMFFREQMCGYSRELFASEIGVSPKTVERWESKKKESLPKGDLLLSIVKKFPDTRISLNWLVSGDGEPYPGARSQRPDMCGPLPNEGQPTGGTSERTGPWGKTEHIKQDGIKMAVSTHEPKGPSHPMSPIKAVESLTTILQSGNNTIIRAILSNLEAFGSAVEQETRDKARIAALEEECSDLRSRMTNLEEKMSRILEAQEQKKTANA